MFHVKHPGSRASQRREVGRPSLPLAFLRICFMHKKEKTAAATRAPAWSHTTVSAGIRLRKRRAAVLRAGGACIGRRLNPYEINETI
jgi:hypothetical protein